MHGLGGSKGGWWRRAASVAEWAAVRVCELRRLHRSEGSRTRLVLRNGGFCSPMPGRGIVLCIHVYDCIGCYPAFGSSIRWDSGGTGGDVVCLGPLRMCLNVKVAVGDGEFYGLE